MESSRLKNIIILILALVNLCLLGLLVTRIITGRAAQAEARAQMVELFAAEGVSLDEDQIPDDTPPAGLTLIRDAGEERKLAEFLLGDALIAADDGGGGVVARGFDTENGNFHVVRTEVKSEKQRYEFFGFLRRFGGWIPVGPEGLFPGCRRQHDTSF